MHRFLRTWFGLISAGLLVIFGWNLWIMRGLALYPISWTVLVLGLVFAGLAWRCGIFLNNRGRINDWLSFGGLLLLAVPLTLLVLAFAVVVVIQYPKDPRYEMQFVPPPLTAENEAAYKELVRWITHEKSIHLQEEDWGPLRNPLHNVAHPAPELGALPMRGFISSAHDDPEPTEELLSTLEEFWRFLAENDLSGGQLHPRAFSMYSQQPGSWAHAYDWEVRRLNEREHLTPEDLQRIILILHSLEHGSVISWSIDSWTVGNRALTGLLLRLEKAYAEGEVEDASDLRKALEDLLDKRDTPFNRLLASESKDWENLIRNDFPEQLLYFYDSGKWMNDTSGSFLTYGWSLTLGLPAVYVFGFQLISDWEDGFALSDQLFAQAAKLGAEAWGPEHETFLADYGHWTMTFEEQMEYEWWKTVHRRQYHSRLIAVPDYLDKQLQEHLALKSRLQLHITALTILETGEIPEPIPLDPASGKPLIVQRDAQDPLKITLIAPPTEPVIPEDRSIPLRLNPKGEQ